MFIDLPDQSLPLRAQLVHYRTGDENLTGLRLRGHAVGGMDGNTGNIPLLKLDRPVVTADADGNMGTLRIDTHAVGDALLHLVCRVEGIVSRREGRHDLVTHGLDDRAPEILGRLLHHPQALLNRLPGTLVAEVFIELRAADDVCKQY